MIKKVYGKSNGLDIVFTQDQNEGKWNTTIPRDASGTYYLELYAEDEAGNVGYIASVIMNYDPVSFCVSFDVIDFQGNAEMKEFIDSLRMQNTYGTKFKGADDRCCC